jgi:hypothetical protein
MASFENTDLTLLKILSENFKNTSLTKRLLKISKPSELIIVFELCKNILANNVPISQKQKQTLKKYESKLVFLSERNKSFNAKINILLKNKIFFQNLLKIGKEFIIDSYFEENNSDSDSEDFEDY